MVYIWRLTSSKYEISALSGEGSRLAGGRWSLCGTPVVYAAESYSLAVLETLVHYNPKHSLSDYRLLKLKLENTSIVTLDQSSLPENWDEFLKNDTTAQIGTNWAKSLKSLSLKVPSVIFPEESNYLLNPLHPDMGKVEIVYSKPFKLDNRILKLLTSCRNCGKTKDFT